MTPTHVGDALNPESLRAAEPNTEGRQLWRKTGNQIGHCVLRSTVVAGYPRGSAALDLCRRLLLKVAKELLGSCVSTC